MQPFDHERCKALLALLSTLSSLAQRHRLARSPLACARHLVQGVTAQYTTMCEKRIPAPPAVDYVRCRAHAGASNHIPGQHALRRGHRAVFSWGLLCGVALVVYFTDVVLADGSYSCICLGCVGAVVRIFRIFCR